MFVSSSSSTTGHRFHPEIATLSSANLIHPLPATPFRSSAARAGSVRHCVCQFMDFTRGPSFHSNLFSTLPATFGDYGFLITLTSAPFQFVYAPDCFFFKHSSYSSTRSFYNRVHSILNRLSSNTNSKFDYDRSFMISVLLHSKTGPSYFTGASWPHQSSSYPVL